jgi:hypothetical protein
MHESMDEFIIIRESTVRDVVNAAPPCRRQADLQGIEEVQG